MPCASACFWYASITSLSSMIVIWVLPGDLTTAPRFALLKSYSPRMVLPRFIWTRLVSGYDSSSLPTWRVNQNQHTAESVNCQRDKPNLVQSIWIFDGQRPRNHAKPAPHVQSSLDACADLQLPSMGRTQSPYI